MPEINGDWDLNNIENYLHNTKYPLRFSCITSKQYPTVFSLWYLYKQGQIWCAVQEDSAVANILRANQKCGFEVGPNSSPYMGVRGKGNANLHPEKGAEMLEELIDRYLDDSNSKLADWLLSRKHSETAICIEPIWYYSWDYSSRMT